MLQSRHAIEKKERRGIGREYYCFDDRDDPIAMKGEANTMMMLRMMDQSTKMYEKRISMNKTKRSSIGNIMKRSVAINHSTCCFCSCSCSHSCSCSSPSPCGCSCKCAGSSCRPSSASRNQCQKHQANKHHEMNYRRSRCQSHKPKASSFQQAMHLTMLGDTAPSASTTLNVVR